MFSNTKTFKRIEKEAFYLPKLYSIEFTIFLTMNCYLLTTRSLQPMSFHSLDLLVFLSAILFGLVISSLLHNTSHENIPNKFLNYLVGEFCGAWVMYGYRNFLLVHILHHKFTDDKYDPVNPEGMNFFVFLSAPMRYMIKRAKSYLDFCHKDNPNHKTAVLLNDIFFHLNLILRVTFWYLLLGPKYFLIFYIPSLLTNIFVFAHINYACHRDNENGEVEVVNLNHNLYFKFANIFTMGGYYHKNHHINQNLFNPKYLKSKRASEKYISKEAVRFSKITVTHTNHKLIRSYLHIDNIWGERKTHTDKSLKGFSKMGMT